MIRSIALAGAALSLVGTVPTFAASASTEAPIVLAQGIDVRIGRDRDDFRDRDRIRERRIIREHRVRDWDRSRCRMVIERHRTPNGTVTRRTRTCD